MANVVENKSPEEEPEFADELQPGTSLLHGQYTIDSYLNSGGFGITYLARDSLDRTVVIKECFPGSLCRRTASRVGARSRAHQAEFSSVVERFVQEAKSLSKLEHPNIVGVHQVFEDNDTAYMALDYIDGVDLLDTIEEDAGKLTPETVTKTLRKVLNAVDFIHESNILHRDISPDNILMDKTTGEPLLIDFGAAREEVSKASRVLSALRVVKDGYSPQEFYINGSKQGPSSDLYALGATFYHVIANEIPPGSQTRLAALAESEPDPYVPLATNDKFNKNYDVTFLAAIDKALNVFPKDRIQSAKDWLEMISSGVSDLKTKVKPTKVKPSKRVRTSRVVSDDSVDFDGIKNAEEPKSKSLLLTTAVIAIVAGIGFAVWQSGALDSESPELAIGSQVPSETVAAVDTTTSVEPEDTTVAPIETAAVVDTTTSVEPEDTIVAPGETVAAVDTTTSVEPEDTAEVSVEPEATLPTTETPAGMGFEQGPDGLILPEGVELITPAAELGTETEESAAPQETDVTAALDTEAEAQNTAQEVEAITPPVVPNDVVAAVSTVEDTAAPAEVSEPVVVVDLPEIEVISSVRLPFSNVLPFSGNVASPLTIAKLNDGAPDWMLVGQRIVEVNSQPIQSFADIDVVSRSLFNLGVADTVEVILSVEAFRGAVPIRKTVALGVTHNFALPTGLAFSMQTAGDGQVETVVTESNEPEGGLVVGDLMMGYLATGERVGADISLIDILRREMAKGVVNYSFLVIRDGEQWVVPFGLIAEE